MLICIVSSVVLGLETMSTSILNVLVLYNEPSIDVRTINEHLAAFKKYSCHNIVFIDSSAAEKLLPDLSPFDVIMLHNSVHFTRPSHLPKLLAKKITAYNGIKVLFLQDEYREIDRTAEHIRQLAIDIVFSTVNRDIANKIYHHPWLKKVRFEFLLTGYTSDALIKRSVPDFEDRTLDVSYRARKSPAWYGEFTRQKWKIGEKFNKDAGHFGLNCDISSKGADRLYGDDWYNLIVSSKAVLGTEAGASFMDFTGEVQTQVETYLNNNPQAGFSEIQQRFLQGRDGEIVIKVISPRCFEAAALRTLMIMYEGEYSGILKPYKHYLPLARSHENMEDVVAVLRNPARAAEIIERAYLEIACNPLYSYGTMVDQFEKAIDLECQKQQMTLGHQSQSEAASHLALSYDLAMLCKKNIQLTRGVVVRGRIARHLQRLQAQLFAGSYKYIPIILRKPMDNIYVKLKTLLRRILLQS